MIQLVTLSHPKSIKEVQGQVKWSGKRSGEGQVKIRKRSDKGQVKVNILQCTSYWYVKGKVKEHIFFNPKIESSQHDWKFCLKWTDFTINTTKAFGLLRKEDFLQDVTIVGDDNQQVTAHKLVLFFMQ